VSVRVAPPLAISNGPGVYTARVRESASVKVPSPFEVHNIPALFDEAEPDVIFTEDSVSHIKT